MNSSEIEAPWKDAEVRDGVIPQQRSMFPRPVVLSCVNGDCAHEAFWYPREAELHQQDTRCWDGERWRKGHNLAVEDWNGNEPVPAPIWQP